MSGYMLEDKRIIKSWDDIIDELKIAEQYSCDFVKDSC